MLARGGGLAAANRAAIADKLRSTGLPVSYI